MGLVFLSAPELVSGVFIQIVPACPVQMDEGFFSWIGNHLRKPSHPAPRSLRWTAFASLGAALLGWWLIGRFAGLPAFILPAPEQVAVRFWKALLDGTLLIHAGATLTEVLLGLLAGTAAAVILGYAVAKSRLFEKLVSPYLVATQAIPVVAIAPLLVIWFGPGIFSKVLICALIVFFPVLVNTVVGVRAVPRPFHDLMHSLRATRRPDPAHARTPGRASSFAGRACALEPRFRSSGRSWENWSALTAASVSWSMWAAGSTIRRWSLWQFSLSSPLHCLLYGLVSFLERKLLIWQETFER